MNWFEYLECAVLPCIAIVEIIVLTLSYHFRTNFSTCGRHCVVLYPLLRQINLLLYHYNIDSRSVFSVLLNHKIPYCMACWKTIKVSCVHLCDFIYHLVLFYVSFCFQAYRMDTSLPNYVYFIFHLGYDIYCTSYYYIFLHFSEIQEKQRNYERTNK